MRCVPVYLSLVQFMSTNISAHYSVNVVIVFKISLQSRRTACYMLQIYCNRVSDLVCVPEGYIYANR